MRKPRSATIAVIPTSPTKAHNKDVPITGIESEKRLPSPNPILARNGESGQVYGVPSKKLLQLFSQAILLFRRSCQQDH